MPHIVTSSRHPKSPSAKAPLFIGVAVLTLIAFFLFVFRSGKATTPPSPAPNAQGSLTSKATSAVQAKGVSAASQKAPTPRHGKTAAAATVEDIASFDGGNEAADDTFSDSTNAVAEAETNKPKPMPYGVLSKQHFDNPVENCLEKLGIPGRGVAMSLPNRLSNDKVMEILRRPIEIYEDDDEDTVTAKERTAAMKTEALKYIEEGGTYDEFVAEMSRISNEEYTLKTTARSEMMRVLKEEGYEAAEAYLEQVNPTLKEAGLKEMKIPLPFRVKRQKELERAGNGN